MHRDAQRFYAALGVLPDASDEAIRHAFRVLAKTVHPDAETGDAAAFIRLKRAYDTLSDPDRRAAYDRDNQPHRFNVPPRPEPMRPPPPPMPVHRRRFGRGWGRNVAVFLVMATISIGAVEAMISFFQAPPSIQTRGPDRVDTTPAASEHAAPAAPEAPALPGSSKSGFWDPSPPSQKRN